MIKYFIGVVIASTLLFAESETLIIDAQNFQGDDKKGISTFTGDVKIKKGDDKLNAQRVDVFFETDPKTNKKTPLRYEATNNADFEVFSKDKHYVGNGDKIIYTPNNEEYTIIGNGFIHELTNDRKIYGERIFVNQITGEARVKGSTSKPVKFIINIDHGNKDKTDANKDDKTESKQNNVVADESVAKKPDNGNAIDSKKDTTVENKQENTAVETKKENLEDDESVEYTRPKNSKTMQTQKTNLVENKQEKVVEDTKENIDDNKKSMVFAGKPNKSNQASKVVDKKDDVVDSKLNDISTVDESENIKKAQEEAKANEEKARAEEERRAKEAERERAKNMPVEDIYGFLKDKGN